MEVKFVGRTSQPQPNPNFWSDATDFKTTEMNALKSIYGFNMARGDSSGRKIFDLWFEGDTRTVHGLYTIYPDGSGWIQQETWLKGQQTPEPGGGRTQYINKQPLVEAIWLNARQGLLGSRIGSIEFLLAGDRNMTVEQVVDGAMKSGGLCHTGRCTYVPEQVTLPRDDDVWYVRIKWRPENQAGFRHCVPDSHSVKQCVVCFDSLDWFGYSDNTPVCLDCGHFLCVECVMGIEAATIQNQRAEPWHTFENRCPQCNWKYTEKKRWIPAGDAQKMWEATGKFESLIFATA
jgi:hypothetical protein